VLAGSVRGVTALARAAAVPPKTPPATASNPAAATTMRCLIDTCFNDTADLRQPTGNHYTQNTHGVVGGLPIFQAD
jgi:hypothetical protein